MSGQWQQCPLSTINLIVYFDALRPKIRDEGTIKNKAVYLAMCIRADGRKEVLGLWIKQTEGAGKLRHLALRNIEKGR